MRRVLLLLLQVSLALSTLLRAWTAPGGRQSRGEGHKQQLTMLASGVCGECTAHAGDRAEILVISSSSVSYALSLSSPPG